MFKLIIYYTFEVNGIDSTYHPVVKYDHVQRYVYCENTLYQACFINSKLGATKKKSLFFSYTRSCMKLYKICELWRDLRFIQMDECGSPYYVDKIVEKLSLYIFFINCTNHRRI